MLCGRSLSTAAAAIVANGIWGWGRIKRGVYCVGCNYVNWSAKFFHATQSCLQPINDSVSTALDNDNYNTASSHDPFSRMDGIISGTTVDPE